ncbi:hypothetical protein BDN70DRAFT_706386 [Pholiota conissans]|uniref:F-box domain-containing protein n=1 Tax=Pholiota conissans TaxID=109636 RepID=A0A9P5ZFP4_9AGAR|nr:hypothetical protein BDN70DRAFT_706386 [Pholiota conissans]
MAHSLWTKFRRSLMNSISPAQKQSFSFPPELIEAIVEHLAPVNYDEPLDAHQRRDLASCGLVSNSFYYASRKYLFATVEVRIVPEARRLSGLQLGDLLSANPLLQQHVLQLVLVLAPRVNMGANSTESSDVTEGEHLARIMHLMPVLQKLSIDSDGDMQFVQYSDNLASLLDKLRSFCPSLHRLRISKTLCIPMSSILEWTIVTDLELYNIFLVPHKPVQPKTGNVDGVVAVQLITRLSICALGCYPELLYQSLDLTHLQYLDITLKPHDRTWRLAGITFPRVTHLSVKDVFSAYRY